MATAAKKRTKAKPRRAYRWKVGKRFRVSAAVVGATIEEIRRRDGSVTPAAFVEEVRDPRHPAHRAIDWDREQAARKWWEYQARVLINSVRVVVQTDGEPDQEQVAFVSVTTRESGRAYLSTSAVMNDEEYREESLADALAALQGWRRRYAHLRELSEVFAVVDRVAKKKAA
jgi:hypothetical protein